MKLRFEAAVFDMDGTILDSMTRWRSTHWEFLDARGLPMPEEMAGREILFSSSKAARIFIEKYGLTMTVDEIICEYEYRMSRHYGVDIGLKPGARRLLDALQARRTPMCVATLTPQKIAENALRKQALTDYFEFICCSADTGLKKGDPAFFRLMADRLGCTAEKVCVFEDSIYAMKAARAAGCAVCAIRDVTNEPDQPEMEHVADVVVDSFDELLDQNEDFTSVLSTVVDKCGGYDI